MDWNNDGILDLIVGERYGKIHLYLRNESGNLTEQPQVSLSDGSAIDVVWSASPDIVDWNNDGLFDMVVGLEIRSEEKFRGPPAPLQLYLNSGSPGNPVFAGKQTIKNGIGSAIQASAGRPDVADVNNDGKKDLVIGNQNKSIYYWENVGTDSDPKFEGMMGARLTSNGGTINIDQYLCPRIYDWNKDAKPDLIVSGTQGYLHLYMNDSPTEVMINPEVGQVEEIIVSKTAAGKIELVVGKTQVVSVALHAVDGRKIKDIRSGTMLNAGRHSIAIDYAGVTAGAYILVVKAETAVQAVKMLHVRKKLRM